MGIRVSVCGLIFGALMWAGQAQAQVSQAYLFSTWSSPTNNSVAPFTLTGTGGVKLFLNGSGVATGQVSLTSSVSVNVDFAFQYLSNTGTINPGEGFAQNSAAMGTRVNSEIGRLDDAGLFQEGTTDAPLNLDFTAGAKVVLQKFNSPLSHIIIAEDAGLDPLKLEWCANSSFSSGVVTLFNGFNTTTLNAILNRSDFGADDKGSDIDQIYLLKFANGLQPGYLRITEIGDEAAYCDLNGTRLEVDFAGGATLTVVPEPSTILTVGSSLALLLGLLRRRRR